MREPIIFTIAYADKKLKLFSRSLQCYERVELIVWHRVVLKLFHTYSKVRKFVLFFSSVKEFQSAVSQRFLTFSTDKVSVKSEKFSEVFSKAASLTEWKNFLGSSIAQVFGKKHLIAISHMECFSTPLGSSYLCYHAGQLHFCFIFRNPMQAGPHTLTGLATMVYFPIRFSLSQMLILRLRTVTVISTWKTCLRSKFSW